MILNARASNRIYKSTLEPRPGESFACTYNKRNRLASVTRNTVAYASYTYNALEQLTSRNTQAVGAPAGTVHYLYDQDNHLIAEANAVTGAITRDYIWLASNDNDPIDLPLAIAETTTLTTVHADHLGRPTRMTNATKATVWQATWKPWGEIHTLSGTLTQNLRYPGQYFQIETGYHYNHHRNYDPITGRYTQPDPLRFIDGPSIYAYAGNSPYMNTDRDGQLIQRIVVGAAIGAGFDIGVQLYNNGGRLECVNWGSVGRSALIGAGFSGAGVPAYFKGLKAFRFFRGNYAARRQYPGKANRMENHHNHPQYMGGASNWPTTRLNGAYHQRITNEFRNRAPFSRDKGFSRPPTSQEAREIIQKVYNKYPLTWW